MNRPRANAKRQIRSALEVLPEKGLSHKPAPATAQRQLNRPRRGEAEPTTAAASHEEMVAVTPELQSASHQFAEVMARGRAAGQPRRSADSVPGCKAEPPSDGTKSGAVSQEQTSRPTKPRTQAPKRSTTTNRPTDRTKSPLKADVPSTSPERMIVPSDGLHKAVARLRAKMSVEEFMRLIESIPVVRRPEPPMRSGESSVQGDLRRSTDKSDDGARHE